VAKRVGEYTDDAVATFEDAILNITHLAPHGLVARASHVDLLSRRIPYIRPPHFDTVDMAGAIYHLR
jgi:hypothetical protein